MRSWIWYLVIAVVFTVIGTFLRKEYDRVWSRSYVALTSTRLDQDSLLKIEVKYPSSSRNHQVRPGVLLVDLYNGSNYYVTDVVLSVTMTGPDGQRVFERPYRIPHCRVESLAFSVFEVPVVANSEGAAFDVNLVSAQGNPHRAFR